MTRTDTVRPQVAFAIDGGAVYVITDDDGTGPVDGIVAQGTGQARTRWQSPYNAVEVTGKVRRQPGGRYGARAVLVLDLGGLSDLARHPGVLFAWNGDAATALPAWGAHEA